MKPDQLSKLANDLIDAKALADATTRGDYGGTCNFDSPALVGLRLREHQIENIAEITGVRLSRFTWMGRVAYWVHTGTYGQGSDNTKCAEVACNLLKERGWDVTMYYQMD